MFKEIEEGIDKHGILSVDLETTSKDPYLSDTLLIAMASGRGRDIRTTAVRPTKEAVSFLTTQLQRPEIRIVGFNFFNFDLECLHLQKIVTMLPVMEVKAKVIDVLPMVWLLNENLPHNLKWSVKHYLGYDMVTYDEAFVSAPAAIRIREVQKEIAEIKKNQVDKVPSWLRRRYQEEKRRLESELKTRFEGRRKKSDNEDKRRLKSKITEHLDEKFGHKDGALFVPNPESEIQRGQQIFEECIDPRERQLDHLRNELALTQREYAKDDAKQTLRLYYHVRAILKKMMLLRWVDIEIEVKRISAQMELRGLYLEPDRIDEVVSTAEPLLKEFEAEVYDHAKQEFNIGSPLQLKKVLYEDLGIEPFKKEKRVGGKITYIPDYSTKEAVLVRMQHPIAAATLNQRTLSKLLSSFGHKIQNLLKTHPTKRINVRFNTNGPKTGRWSSSRFNAQQIPSRKKPHLDPRIQGLGPHIRFAFRAPPGMRYIGADLSQIELRLIGHITKDHNLLRIYNEYDQWNGMKFYTGDIHNETRKSISEMASFDIGRKLSKNINFGLCFDMSPRGFARYARVYKEGTEKREYDFEMASKFWHGFHDTYPGIQATIGQCKNKYRSFDTPFGHSRWKKFQLISGRWRRFLNQYETSEPASPGTIFNSLIQGGAADILKVIIWAIDKYLLQHPDFAGTELVLQVHDEVGIYAPEAIAKKVGILVKYIMELPWFKLDMPVLASAKITDDWSQQDEDSFAEIGVVPPPSTGIKPCVAMLSPRQIAWASQYVDKVENFMYRDEKDPFVPLEGS